MWVIVPGWLLRPWSPSQGLHMSAEDFFKLAFMRLSLRLDQTIKNQLVEK